jgi:glycosyltransferase involved in cell wall biosynthesis
MRIGILFTGVENEFIGGAERFFADFYDIYNSEKEKANEVFFITDKDSFFVFREKLKKLRYNENVIFIPNFKNRHKYKLESIIFIGKVLFNRIDIIHVGSYGRQYFHLLNSIKFLPQYLRPKIVINIVDCEIPYALKEPLSLKYKEYKIKYDPLFEKIKINAIYSWYKLFKEFADSNNIIKSNPYIECVATRFSDTERFIPSINKKNEIIFAARLNQQKQPLFFLQAIQILKKDFFDQVKEWKFLIYGKGPLEGVVKKFIQENNLEDVVSLRASSDLSQVFAHTKCFVSTQDYENFPSLSMCEAMAAGNAIIARNVGQTEYFVKHNKNGFLIGEDTPQGLADVLKMYISNTHLHQDMQNESIRLTKDEHTAPNFIKDIDQFWSKVHNEY